ncbi:MAG TPA: aminotransferase [Devosiaceae bacterium]|nr:aminotransferase [Devosiaceae bacterium]
MTNPIETSNGAGLAAIEAEMARQVADSIASISAVKDRATEVAAALRATGRLLLLGMGASHAAGRIVEPIYRSLGIEAIALPISEQLTAPLPTGDKVVLVASQSGESAEVIRWLDLVRPSGIVFGLTLDGASTLARSVPSLIGAGGAEIGFAATRSLTVTLALHAAILAELGVDPALAIAALQAPPAVDDLSLAVSTLAAARAVVSSGRELHGVADALALGICELARIPAFALEGGQFRHGPLEMLGPEVGVILVRSDEVGAPLVAGAATAALDAGSPVVVFDSSAQPPILGAVTFAFPVAKGLAAVFAMLLVVQRLMLGLAGARVADVGTPKRSSKITRTE